MSELLKELSEEKETENSVKTSEGESAKAADENISVVQNAAQAQPKKEEEENKSKSLIYTLWQKYRHLPPGEIVRPEDVLGLKKIAKEPKNDPEKFRKEAIVESKEPKEENVSNASFENTALTDTDAEPVKDKKSKLKNSDVAKKVKPVKEQTPRKPIDFKKIWIKVCAVITEIAVLALNCIKIAASVVRVHMRAINAGLVKFLSFAGASTVSVLSRGVKKFSAVLASSVKIFWQGFRAEAVKIAGSAVSVLSGAGRMAWNVLSAICGFVFNFIITILSKIFGAVFGWIGKKFRQPLLEIWCFLITPFAHAWGGVDSACKRLKKASKRGFIYIIGSILDSVWRFFRSLIEVLRFGFNYIAPIVCIIFLVALIRYASTLQYAISVTYNGSDIGTIENEATFNEAQSLIQDKVTFTENDDPILVTPTFSVTVIDMDESQKQLTDDIDRLSETMIESGDVQVVYAYGFYINGELFGVYSAEDMEKIRSALETKLNSYSTVNAVDVTFEDDIMFQEGRYIQDVLSTPDDALELINGGTTVEAYYKIQSGDTVQKICDTLRITQEEFERDNPEMASNGLYAGELVTYHYTEPHLNVLTTYYEAYDQVIERTVEYEEVSWLEQYNEILLQYGSDGYENVTALVTLTNGIETDRTIVSRTILEEMVPRRFRVGSAPNTYLDSTNIIDTLGTFCWPVGGSGGYISTIPGWRSWDHSYHMALDIAGINRGTPIYAACSGRVTMSNWYNAYGKLIIIDCGYGYECYYGHCSELLVSEGDWVEKGDLIGEVGMTGSASGNHLHFEMRYYDQRINPLNALGGYCGHDIKEY